MNRRKFIQYLVPSALSVHGLQGAKDSQNMPEPRDEFGGNKNKHFKATGFFRTERDDDRWWLVSPKGNAFISFGVNHYHADWWAQEHNRDYWIGRFKAKKPFDDSWNAGFKAEALKDLKFLGINTLGVHTDASMLTEPPGQSAFPYVATYTPLKLSHYLPPSNEVYMDVFSDEYKDLCDAVAKETVAPYANDPMIVGFCMSDCPVFSDDEAQWYNITTFPRQIRNLGKKSPGKKAYVELMSTRYDSIDHFNNTYKAKFRSWDQLLETKNWREDLYPDNSKEKQDNEQFLYLCVDAYYKNAKNSFRKYNKNHLFLGDKLNGNSNGLESVIKITSKYTDVVNFQYYADLETHKTSMDRWSKMITHDQPIINGDSGFTVPCSSMPNPYGPHCKTQKARAEMTLQYVKDSLERDNFVGWHMCGIIDTIKTMPSKEFSQHQGLMTIKGTYYDDMENCVREISSNLYKFASNS